jgi:hypothetical protein
MIPAEQKSTAQDLIAANVQALVEQIEAGDSVQKANSQDQG